MHRNASNTYDGITPDDECLCIFTHARQHVAHSRAVVTERDVPDGTRNASPSYAVHTYACMYVCMYVGIDPCMYVCMYVCGHACMHACMHVCMYVRTCENNTSPEPQRLSPTTLPTPCWLKDFVVQTERRL